MRSLISLLISFFLSFHIFSGSVFAAKPTPPPKPPTVSIVSVPEFGLIPWMVASLTSGGILFFLKKHNN